MNTGLLSVEYQTFWFALGSIGSLLAVIVASIALWQASRINESQRELTKTVHEQQIKFAQRQLFIPLFEQLKHMPTINPQAPIWPEVIQAVNLLDLLATAWEGELVDEQILLRAYREIFIETYDSVGKCHNNPSGIIKDGQTMLRDSRAATTLYDKLIADHLNQNKPSSVIKK